MNDVLLTENLITFGKYRGKNIDDLLKDRNYCSWILQQKWFENSYTSLYNQVKNYNPKVSFLKSLPTEDAEFLNNYIYFNFKKTQDVDLPLNDNEIICFEFYKHVIETLRTKIIERRENLEQNIYDIKAPSNWLQSFENETKLDRMIIKNFLKTYDLPNISSIVEDIKNEGGIKYNGRNSFLIAKKKSLDQEAFWGDILKNLYGDKISCQFKYKNCFFDFINISTNTIYECKLGIKDFNEEQYDKYLLVLEKYKIVYLIDTDCVIDLSKNKMFCKDKSKYENKIAKIYLKENKNKMDTILLKVSLQEDLDFLKRL